MGIGQLHLRWHHQIAEVSREAWDALAERLEVPTLEWRWLNCLEESGSVRAETGWLPCHLTAWSGSDLVAAAPLYVKGHSEGEFVWDHAWADAAAHRGIPYYPKLVGMSPATPVQGYRFLVAPGEDEGAVTELLLEAVTDFCRRAGLASAGFHYVDPGWRRQLEARGFLAWQHPSFLWENPALADFDGYLSLFDRNQRRNVRRERKAVRDAGLLVRVRTGEAIRPADLDAVAGFYASTNAKFGPWAARYLAADFFRLLGEGFRHRLLLVAAEREGGGGAVAASFLLTKGSGLWGRYWGSRESVDALHFELCYYAPIEWAISHGVTRFDPGIGGSHKTRRGFRAVPNWSCHRFFDPRLQRLFATHIAAVNEAEQARLDDLNRGLPFAEGPGTVGRQQPAPSPAGKGPG